MQAVLIGATAKLDRMWTEDYRSTGTFHALVISGSHVARSGRRACSFSGFAPFREGLRCSGPSESAWLYAGITGWQAPVLRSAAGMTLYGIGRLFYREGPAAEYPRGCGAAVRRRRSGTTVRCQFPAFIPGCRADRRLCGARPLDATSGPLGMRSPAIWKTNAMRHPADSHE